MSREILKYNIIFIFITLFLNQDIVAQGSPPPPGGPNGNPSCWPPSPTCDPGAPIPINEGITLLLISGLWFVITQNKKNKKNKKNKHYEKDINNTNSSTK